MYGSNLTTKTFIIIACLISESYQGIFDSVSDIWDIYDGAQCSLQIIEVFLVEYNRPICCFYWKVKKFLEMKANQQCESPENLRKILSGEMFQKYVDFSKTDCSRYPEDSPDCDRLWVIVLIAIIGQTLLMLFFLCTSVFLTYWVWKHRKIRTKGWIKAQLSESMISSLTMNEQVDDSDSDDKHPKKDDVKKCHTYTSRFMEDDEDKNPYEQEDFVYPIQGNGFIALVSNDHQEETNYYDNPVQNIV